MNGKRAPLAGGDGFTPRAGVGRGLVDLVVSVRRHGGGGHCLTFPGERFVGRVAEDIAEVDDRGGDFRKRHCSAGTERETGDGRHPLG
jgi:hypothetical protein